MSVTVVQPGAAPAGLLNFAEEVGMRNRKT